MDLEQARAEFAPVVTYVNTATFGLPPRSALDALSRAQDLWREGLTDAPAFDANVNRGVLFPFLVQAGRGGVRRHRCPVAGRPDPGDGLVRPERLDELVPHSAGWYTGEDPWASIYGSPLRLARDAAEVLCGHVHA